MHIIKCKNVQKKSIKKYLKLKNIVYLQFI